MLTYRFPARRAGTDPCVRRHATLAARRHPKAHMNTSFLRRRSRPDSASDLDYRLWAMRMSTAFQPIRSLGNGRTIGVEALTRFPSTTPGVFFARTRPSLPTNDMELLAIEKALVAGRRVPSGLYLSVNLSPSTILDARLLPMLSASGIDLGRIVLELTQGTPIDDYAVLTSKVKPLRDRGLRIAIDNFGAGHASLRHLVELKPDFVKVDPALVAGIDEDPVRRALGAALVGFARATDTALIAHGIETEAQRTTVAQLGFDAGQGFLLGTPVVSPDQWEMWGNT